jgi:hypothetical protein
VIRTRSPAPGSIHSRRTIKPAGLLT